MSIDTAIAYVKSNKAKIQRFMNQQGGKLDTSFKKILAETKDLTDYSAIQSDPKLKAKFMEWQKLVVEKTKAPAKAPSQTKRKQTRKKQSTICKVPQHKARIRDVDEPTRVIRRFLAFNNRTRKGRDLLNLKNTIDRYVNRGLIDCRSSFKELIVEIDKRLVNALNQIDDLEKEIDFDITDQKFLCKMIQAVGSAEVYPSIKLLNRILGIHARSKQEVGEKAARLHKAIENAIKKQRIREEDPFFSELMKHKKALKKFLSSSDKTIFKVSKSSLSGLNGLMNGLGYVDGLSATDREQQALDEFIDNEKRRSAQKKSIDKILANQETEAVPVLSGLGNTITLDEGGISSLSIDENNEVEDLREPLPFPTKYQSIIGKPKGRMLAMLYGKRGGGKTTFLLNLARDYANKGKRIAYVSFEEIRKVFDPGSGQNRWRIEETLKERIRQTRSQHQHIFFFGQLPSNVHEFDLVIVDSVSHAKMSDEDLEEMISKGANTSFIFIFHMLKDGTAYKGGTHFQHLVDVIWFLDIAEGMNRIISVEDKNRHAFMEDNELIGQGSFKFKLG